MTRIRRWSIRFVCAGLLVMLLVPGTSAGKAGDVRREAFRLLNEGVTAYKNGDFAVAVEKLERSASMALNSFRAHFYLGLALIGDRRYADALEPLNIALDLDPRHLQSLIALGDAYRKMGDLGEANAALFRALKLRAEFPPALDGLAQVYESQGQEADAIVHYKRSIAADRGFAPAYTHLGDLYLRLGRFEEAVRLLEEAVSVRPDFAAGLNRLAVAYGRLGLNNEAIATIQRAMELEPKNAAHSATLGELQLSRASIAAAEKSFRLALDLDPGQPEALAGLGEVARRRGKYDEALAWLDTALEDARLDSIHAARLGKVRESIVAEEAEAARLEQLVASGQATSRELADLALLYAGRGLWNDAAELQRRVGPGTDSQERLAYLLFRAHRYREAHNIYAALAAESESPALALNDGVTLAMLGDERSAIAAYRKALALEPANPTARLFLGNALLRSGDRDGAVAAYAEFLRSGTEGERAERVRRILAQIAPEALPEKPTPDLSTEGIGEEGAGS